MRMETVPPLLPACPTCGKVMRHTGYSPTCDSVIYDFLCSDDGDRLSWRRRASLCGPVFLGPERGVSDRDSRARRVC